MLLCLTTKTSVLTLWQNKKRLGLLSQPLQFPDVISRKAVYDIWLSYKRHGRRNRRVGVLLQNLWTFIIICQMPLSRVTYVYLIYTTENWVKGLAQAATAGIFENSWLSDQFNVSMSQNTCTNIISIIIYILWLLFGCREVPLLLLGPFLILDYSLWLSYVLCVSV